MVNFILAMFLGYFVMMIVLLEGWRRALRSSNSSLDTFENIPFISVIIPVRNERKNISGVLTAASSQQYPKDKFEILVINDHSEDDTENNIEKWLEKNPGNPVRMITQSERLYGKKAALTCGIKNARGEIMVTTDADCIMQNNWLKSIAAKFRQDVHLLSGSVKFNSCKSIFSDMQQMEFAALIGTGAATLALASPTMCNGANLAFRKKTFEQVKGYTGNEHIQSGDDEFLLRKIFKLYPNGIKFNADPESVVTTNPASSLKEFCNQRIRWASKWRGHGVSSSAGVAIFLFLFNAILIMLPLSVWFDLLTLQDVALLVVGKIVCEVILIHHVLKFLKIPFTITAYLILQIIYPFYVIFFGLTANFLQAEWKGRKI